MKYRPRNDYENYRIRLTAKQKELASRFVDVSRYLYADDLNDMLGPINDFVIDTMDEDGEPSQEGLMHERLRDDIFYYNEYEDYQPRFV